MGFIKTVFDYFSSEKNEQNIQYKENEQVKFEKSPAIFEETYEEILSSYVDRLIKIRNAKSYASFYSGKETYYISSEKNGLFKVTPNGNKDKVSNEVLVELKKQAMGEMLSSGLVRQFLKHLARSLYETNQGQKLRGSNGNQRSKS